MGSCLCLSLSTGILFWFGVQYLWLRRLFPSGAESGRRGVFLKAVVLLRPMGVFAFAEGELVESVFFKKDPKVIGEQLGMLRKGKGVEAVQELATRLASKGYSELAFEDEVLASAFPADKFSISVWAQTVNDTFDTQAEHLAFESGYVSSAQELRRILHDSFVELARQNVQEASSRRDLMIIQAILTLDDLDKTFNLFANRLREWYGYHFPELSSIIAESDLYVRLIASLGDRINFTGEKLKEDGVGEEKTEQLDKAAQTSMGASLRKEDLEEIVEYAEALLQLYKSRKELEDYLETVMREVAPNTLELTGSTLGARLIAATGSIDNLAKRSASTIQVLGAEKALFRSLRSGSRPPKHGLIFQHNEVHQAPRWQRGKIARALAGKIAIAARLDAYGGEYRGPELCQDFEKRVKEIQERYPQPHARERRRDGRS
jgi:nucleolar protein 56